MPQLVAARAKLEEPGYTGSGAEAIKGAAYEHSDGEEFYASSGEEEMGDDYVRQPTYYYDDSDPDDFHIPFGAYILGSRADD